MKNKLTHNLGMKILSIVLAVLVWLIIVNIDNPVTTVVVNGIEIELENADVLLDAGLTYTVAGNLTASIQVPVRRTAANSVKASDFRAVADCAALYSPTGQVPVTVTKTNTSLHLEGTIDQITESVQLEIEEIQTESFPIQIVPSGTPGEGYTLGSAAVNPEIVTVTAPASIMRSIREARAVIELDGMTESSDQEVSITFIV